MPARPIVTLHAPLAKRTADMMLNPVIELTQMMGLRWWFDTESLPNLILMVDCPEEWCLRAPTEKEFQHFHDLYETDPAAARRFVAEGGLPAYLRD